jgi:hypothetical protein
LEKKTPLIVLGCLFLIFGTCINVHTAYTSVPSVTVVAGSDNGNVYVYDEGGNLLWSYYTGADVASVAVSSDGAYIAVGSLGNKLYLFTRDGAKLWENAVPISSGYDGGWMGTESKTVAISAHGDYVVAACTDNLYVYKKDGTLLWSQPGKETCVGVSPCGDYIVACNYEDGTIDFFSSTNSWTKSISAFWVATSDSGYVAASSHNTVYLYDTTGAQIWSYSHSKWDYDFIRVDMPQDGLSVVAVNDDPSNYPGAVLCYWNSLKDGTLGWSSADSTPVWVFEPGGGPGDTDLYSVAISGNGDIIATGSFVGSFVFSSTSNVPLQSFTMGCPNSYDLTFDGQYGACGNRQGELCCFSKDSSTPLWSKTIGGIVHAVALSYYGDVIDVTSGSTPTVDGIISTGEWTDAHSAIFATSGGICKVCFKHDLTNLYVAFDVPNLDAESAVQIFVDTMYDRASAPQTDDYRFTISRRSGADEYGENQGTGTDWTAWGSPVGWSGAHQDLVSTWNAEFSVPYTKLGITAGESQIIGISFWNAWTSTGDYHWPTDASWLDPSTWGAAYSSDNWTLEYTLTIATTAGGTTNPSPGKHTYNYGTVVSVTAIPDAGYTFDHWELDSVTNSTNPISVKMEANQTLYSVFIQIPYAINVNSHCNTEDVDISVSITMDGSPTGYTTPHTFIDLTGTHNFTVPSSDPSGHSFKQWSTGSTSITIIITSGGTYTAYYQAQYTLTITTTDGGTTNPVPGTYTYSSGTVVSVTATPSTDYFFDHWELDGVKRSSPTIIVTMDMNYSLKAVFAYKLPSSSGGGVGGGGHPYLR